MIRVLDEIDLAGSPRKVQKKITPANVEAFVRMEGLIGRFDSILDPDPGNQDLIRILNALNVAPRITPDRGGARAIISAPANRMRDVAILHMAMGAETEYLAILLTFKSMFFRNKIEEFRTWPPTRLIICHSMENNNAVAWAVWDGHGQPINTLSPEPTRLFWTSPAYCRIFGS